MRDKSFKYEFGRNIKLKNLVTSWKHHNDYRGFVIVAPSGYGKTTLLNGLKSELANVSFVSGYQLIEQIYYDVRLGKLYRISNNDYEVLLIDHLDDIDGREAVTQEICYRLKWETINSKGENRLIICTFINERIAVQFAKEMNYELIFLKRVKPNLRIVKEKANEFGLKLNKTQLYGFADFDSMLALRQAFDEIHSEV